MMLRDQALLCLETLNSTAAKYEGQLAEKINEQRTRFELWATNIDIFATDNFCLDYCLRNDCEISSLVGKMIETITTDALAVHHSLRMNPESQHKAHSSIKIDTISKTISRLQRISLAIRAEDSEFSLTPMVKKLKASRIKVKQDHQDFADRNEPNGSSFDDFIREMLHQQYPLLSYDILDILSTISFARRQKFEQILNERRDIMTKGDKTTIDGYSLDSHSYTQQRELSFGPNKFVPTDSFPDSSSTLSNDSISHVNGFVPPAPKLDEDCQEKECPYCHWVLPRRNFTSRNLWRSHVEDDLKPYVCLHDDCIHVPRIYSSREAWVKHTNNEHFTGWLCPMCNSKEISASIEEHFDQCHKLKLSASQVYALNQRVKRVGMTPVTGSCPFCVDSEADVGAETLVHHVADHLLSISLVSFSVEKDDKDDVNKQRFDDARLDQIKGKTLTKSTSRDQILFTLETDDKQEIWPENVSSDQHRETDLMELDLESETGTRSTLNTHQQAILGSSRLGQGDKTLINKGKTDHISGGLVPVGGTSPTSSIVPRDLNAEQVGMASNESPEWVWSADHNDHYYVTYNSKGQAIYHFSKQSAKTRAISLSGQGQSLPPQNVYPQCISSNVCSTDKIRRADSGSFGPAPGLMYSASYYGLQLNTSAGSSQYDQPNMPPPAPYEYRALPNFIPGTPEQGWYERLDSSYRMRTGSEAHQFFKKGRVFSMLYTEAESEAIARNGSESSSVTVVRFGEAVYSQIRRFVVVSVKRHFVYACGISTYSGRATTKPGCNPAEHAIAYFSGIDPRFCYVTNEYGNGMYKDPIQIDAADSSLTMLPASRIRFGKTYSIECNVKVKDIGRVIPEHMTKLLAYWKEENQEEY